MTYLTSEQKRTIRARIVEAALGEWKAGAHETGTNRGPFVKKYAAVCGMPDGLPWCLFFALWGWQEAGVKGFKKTGLCAAFYAWAKLHGHLTREPKPGDIGLRRGGARGHDHAGLVKGLLGKPGKTLFTVRQVEGNTNQDGGREGKYVLLKWRNPDGWDYVSVESVLEAWAKPRGTLEEQAFARWFGAIVNHI